MSFIEMNDIVKVYGKLTILHKVNMSLYIISAFGSFFSFCSRR